MSVDRKGAFQPTAVEDLIFQLYYKVDQHRGLPRRERVLWDFLHNFERHVIYEDGELLVIDKPSGILSHANEKGMIGVEEVARYIRSPRVTRAHRLDRETSGVLLFAKTASSEIGLDILFARKRDGEISKVYVSVLEGAFESPPNYEVSVDLGYDASGFAQVVGNSRQRKGYKTIKDSTTLFTPLCQLQSDGGAVRTLTRVQLITGRTHQIRAVSAHLGHPVAGDGWYGHPVLPRAPRLMLHAKDLTIIHPTSGVPMTFTSPVPQDIRDFLTAMEPLV